MRFLFGPPPVRVRLERVKRELEHELIDSQFDLLTRKQHVETLQSKLEFINKALEKMNAEETRV